MNWHIRKFNIIAPIYQLFFSYQSDYYSEKIKENIDYLNLKKGSKVLDLGSGTGAFAKGWQNAQFKVKAADAAPAMIKKCRENGLDCIEADLLEGLKFEDSSFDIVTAAYLAHGLSFEERKKLYKEASRIASQLVIFHDFGDKENLFINIIEAIEGSYYREFIKSVPYEMESFFAEVEKIKINKWHNWYICKVDDRD